MRAPRSFRRTLERTLGTLALVIGSALPFALAWVLIASTDDDTTPQNPLDRIPDYSGPLQETLSVPAGATVQTTYSYYGTVRLIVEGTWESAAGTHDALYGFPSNGSPRWQPALTIDGQALADVAGWDTANRPPPDPHEHTYTALYAVGKRWRALKLQNVAEAGTLRVTVLQVE